VATRAVQIVRRRPEVADAGHLTVVRVDGNGASGDGENPPSADFVLYVLRQCALFQGLPLEAFQEAAGRAKARSLPRKAVLFQEGEAAHTFSILYSGRVKLTQRTPGGGEALVRVVGEGQACAWPGIVADSVYLATATALEPSHALVWNRKDVADLFDRFPVLSRSALRVLSRRLRELQDRYRELTTERVSQRLARTLLHVVQPDGRRFEDGIFGDVPLSRRDLAQLTGTTLFTVSRLLGQWEKAGVLTAHRERIVVDDAQALSTLVDRRPRPPDKNR
jgi:CRP-like cAMP-binding protein